MTTDSHWLQQYTKFGSYENEVSRNNVRNAYPASAYGKLITSGSVTKAMITDLDGTVLNVPQSVQVSIVSSSASDAAAGTGIRTVVLEYLNGDLELSYEVITLNGTTAVTSVATDIRWIHGIHGATYGSDKAATGNITVSSGGTSFTQIKTGERSNHSSFYRVPAGKRLYINNVYAGSSSGTSDSAVIVEMVSTQINGIRQEEAGLTFSHAGIALQDNSQAMNINLPFPIEGGQIVGFIATCDKGATITAGFMGWIE